MEAAAEDVAAGLPQLDPGPGKARGGDGRGDLGSDPSRPGDPHGRGVRYGGGETGGVVGRVDDVGPRHLPVRGGARGEDRRVDGHAGDAQSPRRRKLDGRSGLGHDPDAQPGQVAQALRRQRPHPLAEEGFRERRPIVGLAILRVPGGELSGEPRGAQLGGCAHTGQARSDDADMLHAVHASRLAVLVSLRRRRRAAPGPASTVVVHETRASAPHRRLHLPRPVDGMRRGLRLRVVRGSRVPDRVREHGRLRLREGRPPGRRRPAGALQALRRGHLCAPGRRAVVLGQLGAHPHGRLRAIAFRRAGGPRQRAACARPSVPRAGEVGLAGVDLGLARDELVDAPQAEEEGQPDIARQQRE